MGIYSFFHILDNYKDNPTDYIKQITKERNNEIIYKNRCYCSCKNKKSKKVKKLNTYYI